MSKIFDLLTKKTKGKLNKVDLGDGVNFKNKQVKISAIELSSAEQNEATIYRNLRDLTKAQEVHKVTFKVRRYKEGRRITFNKSWFWVE